MQTKKVDELALNSLFDYIEKKGLRKTIERETVLKTIYQMDDKVSIEDILKKHQELFPQTHICRSTVYNSVSILLDANVIYEIKDKNCTVYCKAYGNSDTVELICNHCRMTKLIPLDYISTQIYSLGIPDFKIETFRLQLHGICAKCALEK
ncbi:MAG: transcriptional repressor [Candidatus Paraprevotella stercoravium]|jgi:Fur family ferric uptake transcriptional regulator|uniref:Ferric uptake regulation protein n=2 Tax=Bacteroidales TaxID=171549 RepID=A0ABT7U885_9BACE|nr:transcriptional repressor [Candidatus Paraprevotella stercoravium]MDM8146729.1 transcriptional repressor [Bacteroides eggerthii]